MGSKNLHRCHIHDYFSNFESIYCGGDLSLKTRIKDVSIRTKQIKWRIIYVHDLKCGEKHAGKFRLAITTSEGMTLFYLRSVVAAM